MLCIHAAPPNLLCVAERKNDKGEGAEEKKAFGVCCQREARRGEARRSSICFEVNSRYQAGKGGQAGEGYAPFTGKSALPLVVLSLLF